MSNIFDMVDTWNDAGTVFNAIKMNVTDTASNSLSMLLQLMVAGVTKFSVQKTGYAKANQLGVNSGGFLSLNTSTDASLLHADAAGIIAQRNGVNAQAFRVYNTFTDASNYERLAFNWAGNTCTMVNENAGTGAFRLLIMRGILRTFDNTVAALPAASASNKGEHRHVTDALGPAFLAIVAGGGAVVTPVFSDGTNWICG